MGKFTRTLKRAGYIPLHLLIVAVIAFAWWHRALTPVCVVLLVLYMAAFAGMLWFQRNPCNTSCLLSDFFEDTTTTYYFGAVMAAIYLLSRIIENNLILAVTAVVVLAGPAITSLLNRERRRTPASSKQQ
ncbi:YbhQ family protein [Enterobacillus tribolii]|uniref:Putative inner membrane protein YbhQ n=1 Tax=Enterobacillus tribolii TaxID=1487935 RepID=A0A370R4S7_9GAMM|nr:YbhQ family protein [Enterobacillus tribolii]MBW7983348.1 hypothetical protein [Enterobacillus tribolii]RDK97406.1 putative inner membrane protein YbhQ [Enterobacillus tribolii]